MTRYTYYPDGNVRTETNPETGLPTVYEYNSYGLVTSKLHRAVTGRNILMTKTQPHKEELKILMILQKTVLQGQSDDAGRKVQVIPPNL